MTDTYKRICAWADAAGHTLHLTSDEAVAVKLEGELTPQEWRAAARAATTHGGVVTRDVLELPHDGWDTFLVDRLPSPSTDGHRTWLLAIGATLVLTIASVCAMCAGAAGLALVLLIPAGISGHTAWKVQS